MNNQSKKEVMVPASSPTMPLSLAVAFDRLLFVSGSIGRDPVTKEIALGDIKAQTAQVLRNIGAQLEKAGSSLDKVLKATVFITDMRRFAQMNEAYRTFFGDEPPTRSCVQVVALPDPDALVEIEVIAAR